MLPFVAKAEGGSSTSKKDLVTDDTAHLDDYFGADAKAMFQKFEVYAESGQTNLSLKFDLEMVSLDSADENAAAVFKAAQEFIEAKTAEFKEAHSDVDITTPEGKAQLDAYVDNALTSSDDSNIPVLKFNIPIHLSGTATPVFDDHLDDVNTLSTDGTSPENIGTYKITAGTGEGNYILEGTLKKIVYNRTGVTAGGSVSAELTNTGNKDTTPGIDVKDGTVEITVDLIGGGTNPGGDDKPYTITKTASAITEADSNHFLTYTITAKAPTAEAEETQKTLHDMRIEDQIPDGLIVTKVELGAADPKTTLSTPGDYSIDDSGKLIYTIPTPAEGNPAITEVVLTVTTMLTSEKYQEYMKITDGTPTLEFKNTAKLWGTDTSKPAAESSEVKSTLTGKFMDKQGERVGLNSPYWDWTITANTYFTGTNGTVYLIDSIQGIDTAHMYALNSLNQVEFKVNDETASRTADLKTSSFPSGKIYSYGNLSGAELLEGGAALTSAEKKDWLDSVTSSGANAVYYTYNTDTDPAADEAVLLIPLAAADLNKPLTVTYQTKAIPDAGGQNATKALDNKVTMFWAADDVEYNPGGFGSGGNLPEFLFSINKGVDMDYALLKKSAGGYDEPTRTMTWNFAVNYSGREITEATITDTLTDSIQTFDTAEPTSLRYRIIQSDSTVKTDWANVPLGTGDWTYAFTDNDDDTHTLKIDLGKLEADEICELKLKTTVVDPTILSTNNPSPKDTANLLENKAKIDCKIGSDSKSETAEAKKNIPNTILVKDNIDNTKDGNGYFTKNRTNYYDLATHQLYWRVKINQNKADIRAGAYLTDTLPAHTEFVKLLEVKRNNETTPTKFDPGVALNETAQLVNDPNNQTIKLASDGTGKVTFTFEKAFSDTYDLVFTTKITDEYRETIAKENPQKQDHSFTNGITLTGKVADPTDSAHDVSITAADDAKHTVIIPSIVKSGTYTAPVPYPHDAEYHTSYGTIAYASWTIVVNRDAIDMSGWAVNDTLKPWFQMIPESFAIKEGTVTSDGKDITKKSDTNLVGTAAGAKEMKLAVKENGFGFVIPDTYKETPLIITFDTMLIDDAVANNMVNSASLKWSKSGETGTGDEQADGRQDFFAKAYATSAKIPLIQIHKTDDSNHALGDAQFVLTAMKKSGSTWVRDTSVSQKSKTSSTSTGYANFLFLKRDVLYQVVETSAPDGYMPDSRPQYFVFLKTTEASAYPTGTNVHVVDSAESSKTLPFTNNTQSGTIQGKKTNTSGSPLAGAVIGLFPESETVFTSANALQTYVSDNTTGAFHFTAAAGTYKIVEVTPPPQYLLNQSTVYTVTVPAGANVTVDKDVNNNAITIANTKKPTGGGGNPGGGGGNPGGGSNEGYIVIQKSSEDGVLSGFTFEITDGNTYTERFVTDADGRIMTGELPKGTYTVREIAEEGVTDRYELPKAQTVRISGVGTKLNFENKLLPEFIPPDEVPLGGGGGTEPSSPVEEIPDNDVPKGNVETFGPKTGYTGASPLWALMLGLSLAGLGYSVISLLVSRKKGRHVDK